MTNERQIVVFVPGEPGFAERMDPFSIAVVYLVRSIEWLTNPLGEWRERRKALHRHKKWEDKNLRAGKNRDGSYSRRFPASMTLEEMVTELGYRPYWCIDCSLNDRREEMVVLVHRKTPIGELSREQIYKAIIECQVSE